MPLSKEQFKNGMLIFNSCGGPNTDVMTLKVWHKLLSNLNPQDFEGAVISLCEEVTELGPINFVAQIKIRARSLAERRIMAKTAQDAINLLEDGEEYVSKEEVSDFIKKLQIG